MTGKGESKAWNSKYETDPAEGENTFWKEEKDSKSMLTKHWQAPKRGKKKWELEAFDSTPQCYIEV